jgi:hypothetical protein
LYGKTVKNKKKRAKTAKSRDHKRLGGKNADVNMKFALAKTPHAKTCACRGEQKQNKKKQQGKTQGRQKQNLVDKSKERKNDFAENRQCGCTRTSTAA